MGAGTHAITTLHLVTNSPTTLALPHIFERFYRGKRVSQSNIPGTGLGLGIVKEIVDQHRGAIEVESQVGQGSSFRVWLPMDPPASVGPDNEVR